MPVYVDEARYSFGRMLMCHMLADTPAELHAMADRIGVARKWVPARSLSPSLRHLPIEASPGGRCRRDRGDRAARVRRDHQASSRRMAGRR